MPTPGQSRLRATARLTAAAGGVAIYNGGSGGVTISTAGIGPNAGSIAIAGTSYGAGGTNGAYIQGSGIAISSDDGDIAITGSTASTNAAAATGVNLFNGVSISSSGTDSNAGSNSITGSDTGAAGGVAIYNNGGGVTISTVGIGADAGAISIMGTTSASASDAVYLQGGGVAISANDGNISITGNTASTNSGNVGVLADSGTTISSTGTGPEAGTITITGTDTGTGSGLDIHSNGTDVTSVDGAISLTGNAAVDHGMALYNAAAIASTGSGADAATITVIGTDTDVPTSGGPFTDGVLFDDLSVTTNDGNIQVTGSTSSNNGVLLRDSSTIEATGAASITVNGTSTAGFTGGCGVAISQSTLSTSGGNIGITGNTTSDDGVNFGSSTMINATGSGQITVSGTTTTTTGATGYGVDMFGTSELSTQTGSLAITGNSSYAVGVAIYSGSTVQSTSNSSITVSTPYLTTHNDALEIDGGAQVVSGGTVTIQSGGDADLDESSTLTGLTGLSIIGDRGDPGGGTGALVSLLGTMNSGATINVMGGPDGDTINFSPLSSTSTTINGEGGSDAITVSPANVTGTVAVVEPTPNTGASPTLAIEGTAAAEAFAISGTQTTFGSSTVTYTAIPTVSVYGVGGADTFNVAPSLTVSLNVIGEPNTPYLATLAVQTPTGQTSSTAITGSGSGHVTTTGGYKNVNFMNIDITSPILSVTRGGFIYNRGTKIYSQTVTITNSGSSIVTGPISLVLDGLVNGTLTNATGTTDSSSPPSGSPYINLTVGSLAPGASAMVTLLFSDSGNASISYTTRTITGAGPR